MKVAILIGIDKYDKQIQLDACKNDVFITKSIVEKLNKFDEIFEISGKINGLDGKRRLSEFIEKIKQNDIEELFFYYTGHGARYEDDFFYTFSDFEENKKESTGLRNSELDGLFKNLNPELTIKIVDACKSGTTYIKNTIDIAPLLEKSAKDNKLKNIYFFHSSNSEEPSMATPNYSYFTHSFWNALLENRGDVRYRDIMAYIADCFNQNEMPKPTFVVQAKNTEVFGKISEDITNFIRKSLSTEIDDDKNEGKNDLSPKDNDMNDDLINLVTLKSSEEYCTKEEAFESLNKFMEIINEDKWKNRLEKLYSIEIEISTEEDEIPNNIEIGRWLLENTKEDYFANTKYRKEEYIVEEYVKVPKKPISRTYGISNLFQNDDYKLEKVKKIRNVIAGIEYSVDLPFKYIKISYCPLQTALEFYSLSFVLLVSRKNLVVFNSNEKLSYINWENVEESKCKNWKSNIVKLKDHNSIKALTDDILKASIETILADIIKKLK